MSDDELVKRIRQGDEAAAEELIRRWYPSVLRYCRWRLGRGDGAEDLTQETFLRLFRAMPGYRSGGRFKAYLFAIAGRLCIDELQRAVPVPLEEGERLADERDGLRQTEDRDEIRRLLDALPPEQREAVVLRFGEGMTYRDIARATGCDMRTAQSRVRYALKNMRKGIRHGK